MAECLKVAKEETINEIETFKRTLVISEDDIKIPMNAMTKLKAIFAEVDLFTTKLDIKARNQDYVDMPDQFLNNNKLLEF